MPRKYYKVQLVVLNTGQELQKYLANGLGVDNTGGQPPTGLTATNIGAVPQTRCCCT